MRGTIVTDHGMFTCSLSIQPRGGQRPVTVEMGVLTRPPRRSPTPWLPTPDRGPTPLEDEWMEESDKGETSRCPSSLSPPPPLGMERKCGPNWSLGNHPGGQGGQRKNKVKKKQHAGAAGEFLQSGLGGAHREPGPKARGKRPVAAPGKGNPTLEPGASSAMLPPLPVPAPPAEPETSQNANKQKKKRKNDAPSAPPAKVTRGTWTEPEDSDKTPDPAPVLDPTPQASKEVEEPAFKIYQRGLVHGVWKTTKIHPRATGDPGMWKYFTHVRRGTLKHRWMVPPTPENMDYFIQQSTYLRSVDSEFPDDDGICVPVTKHWYVFTETADQFLLLVDCHQNPVLILLDQNKI